MKKHFYLSVFVSIVLISAAGFPAVLTGCKKKTAENTITVYAYDSFTADWGAGPKIAELFEKETGCKVLLVTCEDGGTVLSKAAAEKHNPKADVLIGIDNQLLTKARQADILEPYKPDGFERLKPEIVMADDCLLTPFDYGYFAFMYNTESEVPAPSSLEELTSDKYAKKIVIMDPRTSTPGLGLVSWVQAIYGTNQFDFWKKLKPNILTMSPGWSAGYSLFTSGEAPLVISYTTSLAAHILYDKTEKFQPLIFSSGHILQTEGIGLVKNAANAEYAKKFIDFMLTDEAQSILPETQFMFPSVKDVKLPPSFEKVMQPNKTLFAEPEMTAQSVDAVIDILSN